MTTTGIATALNGEIGTRIAAIPNPRVQALGLIKCQLSRAVGRRRREARRRGAPAEQAAPATSETAGRARPPFALP
jgi:hypothetical protein